MKIAVLTAFTPQFLDQFKLFISSLRQVSKIPVISVIFEDDKRISISQKYECIEERLSPDIIQEYKLAGDRWVQWYKPDIIKKVAEKYRLDIILWLDADIIVLEDISPIINNIITSFTVIKDYFAPSTTLNNPELYQIYPSDNQNHELCLNSGVVGLALPRDLHILDEWIRRSKIAVTDERIKPLISLYDQGALIWTMKELNIQSSIINRPEWNHAPKRHAYEALPNPSWPFGHKTMGGDLFAEIRYDNPNAIIAHFAGYPKITDLLIHNHARSVNYNNHSSSHLTKKKLFVVGLERAGTHTLAELIRKSVKHSSWVRHEASTTFDYLNMGLSAAALAKYRGKESDYIGYIQKRIQFYDRKDVNIVCDCNHRLGFFIDELKASFEQAKFVLLLRSPLELIKSRIANFCLWPALIERFPIDYQLELYKIHTHFYHTVGSYGQNLNRIYPNQLDAIESWDADVIQMHIWEIVNTIDTIMSQMSKLSSNDYQILWIDDLPSEIHKIKNLIDDRYVRHDNMHMLSKHKYGASKRLSKGVYNWINDYVNQNHASILSQFDSIISKHNINYGSKVFI